MGETILTTDLWGFYEVYGNNLDGTIFNYNGPNPVVKSIFTPEGESKSITTKSSFAEYNIGLILNKYGELQVAGCVATSNEPTCLFDPGWNVKNQVGDVHVEPPVGSYDIIYLTNDPYQPLKRYGFTKEDSPPSYNEDDGSDFRHIQRYQGNFSSIMMNNKSTYFYKKDYSYIRIPNNYLKFDK